MAAPTGTQRRSDAARNRAALIRAAIAAVHREGLRVPMATIAADAGVGIGTLYRHFATRDELLADLTHVSFERLLASAGAAQRSGASGSGALGAFLEAVIAQRNELVLPLHGGPPVTAPATRVLRRHVHQAIRELIERGQADGSIGQDVSPRDITVLGAMLAQPRQPDPAWDATARRILATYLTGLSPRD